MFSLGNRIAVAQQLGGSSAEERLATVRLFAFGGVGFAGIKSQGEKDYREVMSRPNRLEIFERVLATGTPEAKSFALVGVYNLNRARFAVLASTLHSSKSEVLIGRGCVISHTTLDSIIQSIGAGRYVRYP